jgi:hypothetical protein
MPFSNQTIDPQYIEALRSAFYKVCLALGLNCKAGDPMTEIIVSKIMDIAKTGEMDPDIICTWVLADFGSDSRRKPDPDRAGPGGQSSKAKPTGGPTE